MRLCSGCQTKVPDNVRLCDECQVERNKSRKTDGGREHTVTDRERYAFLYSGVRWRTRVQPTALRRCPTCSRCQLALSEIVDHIVPAGVAIQQARDSGRFPFDRYAGFYLLSNLQGLCRACHTVKTDQDKAHVGPWPDVMEKEASRQKKQWTL
jgi:5-methylcytosine-specific restriction endonuclease McrA